MFLSTIKDDMDDMGDGLDMDDPMGMLPPPIPPAPPPPPPGALSAPRPGSMMEGDDEGAAGGGDGADGGSGPPPPPPPPPLPPSGSFGSLAEEGSMPASPLGRTSNRSSVASMEGIADALSKVKLRSVDEQQPLRTIGRRRKSTGPSTVGVFLAGPFTPLQLPSPHPLLPPLFLPCLLLFISADAGYSATAHVDPQDSRGGGCELGQRIRGY